jgi:hypothetical protein
LASSGENCLPWKARMQWLAHWSMCRLLKLVSMVSISEILYNLFDYYDISSGEECRCKPIPARTLQNTGKMNTMRYRCSTFENNRKIGLWGMEMEKYGENSSYSSVIVRLTECEVKLERSFLAMLIDNSLLMDELQLFFSSLFQL